MLLLKMTLRTSRSDRVRILLLIGTTSKVGKLRRICALRAYLEPFIREATTSNDAPSIGLLDITVLSVQEKGRARNEAKKST